MLSVETDFSILCNLLVSKYSTLNYEILVFKVPGHLELEKVLSACPHVYTEVPYWFQNQLNIDSFVLVHEY